MLKEFKEFAVKGNMIDIAIGVIIGAAFNKVVDVLVKEIFLPPLSFLTDGINLENKKLILQQALEVNGETTVEEIAIGYGKLLETSVDFLIISLTVFLIVKFINRLKNKAEDVKDETMKTPKDIELLNKVADLLEKQNELLKKQG
jgi:large conductance mechanosensitive channel